MCTCKLSWSLLSSVPIKYKVWTLFPRNERGLLQTDHTEARGNKLHVCIYVSMATSSYCWILLPSTGQQDVKHYFSFSQCSWRWKHNVSPPHHSDLLQKLKRLFGRNERSSDRNTCPADTLTWDSSGTFNWVSKMSLTPQITIITEIMM